MDTRKCACHSLWLVVAISACLTRHAAAHGSIPNDTPVDRLVANLEQYTLEHPSDSQGFYRLGRVHTLALETKSGFALAFDREDPPRPAEGSWAMRNWGEKKPEVETRGQLVEHLRRAIINLNKAIDMSPTEARYRLTLAAVLEAGRDFRDETQSHPLDPTGRPEFNSATARVGVARYASLLEKFPSEHLREQDILQTLRRQKRWWMQDERGMLVSAALQSKRDPDTDAVISLVRHTDWDEQIEAQYFTAMCYALPDDGKASEKPIWGGMEDWVSYEAGKSFIRVVQARQARDEDEIRLKVAKTTIKAFDDLKEPDAITPILVPLRSGVSLDEMISKDTTCEFDLDGSGRAQSWPWVKPDTAILVWDPTRSGKITSGRQLFGSVTWWIFFRDGYQALSMLDDNRDGEVAGPELTGLALWFDRNSNGVSEPGEVEPIEKHNIAALSTCVTGKAGESLESECGVRFIDGRTLPTYDWVATTIATNAAPVGPSSAKAAMPAK